MSDVKLVNIWYRPAGRLK